MADELSDFTSELRGLLNSWLGTRASADIDGIKNWGVQVSSFVNRWATFGEEYFPSAALLGGRLVQPGATWLQLRYWAETGRSLRSQGSHDSAELFAFLNELYSLLPKPAPAAVSDVPPDTNPPYVAVSASGLSPLTDVQYNGNLVAGRAGQFDVFLDAVSGEHGWRPPREPFALNTDPANPLWDSSLYMFLHLAILGKTLAAERLCRVSHLEDPAQAFRDGRRKFEPGSSGDYAVWPTRKVGRRAAYAFGPRLEKSPLYRASWLFLARTDMIEDVMAWISRTQKSQENSGH